MEMITEQGQNFFNETDSQSGGVNSARSDVGAFNLRNIGTGSVCDYALRNSTHPDTESLECSSNVQRRLPL